MVSFFLLTSYFSGVPICKFPGAGTVFHPEKRRTVAERRLSNGEYPQLGNLSFGFLVLYSLLPGK